ncbi:hypothetical protein Q7C_849 [Methylophaga frappieri]|uniref:Uncharacterized protein n=1 Tax=Methylophaga frappieri (strain ATCC BAA-2434 / DSM 25690 / JAM7) TaxID=754477 RepID=I1YGH5_METFJ|nr:hypothetical protein [Methylophaga frappieri]AFJ02018.1 hypothetical protein Q7C_849 [Methylophaga frappieri]
MSLVFKKISDYLALAGSALRGNEFILLSDTESDGSYTATTIAYDAGTKTISDSNNSLPLVKPGGYVQVTGSTVSALNGVHEVVSSTAGAIVITSAVATPETAGASITIAEIAANYRTTLADLQAFFTAASIPNPLNGVNIQNAWADKIRGKPVDVTGNISGNALDFDYDDGDFQYATLSAADTDITVSNMPAGAQLKIILFAADTYAPDVSALTPLLNGDGITFSPVTVILAETLNNTTIRYIAAGGYAS